MTILIKMKGKLSGLAVWQAGQDPIAGSKEKKPLTNEEIINTTDTGEDKA